MGNRFSAHDTLHLICSGRYPCRASIFDGLNVVRSSNEGQDQAHRSVGSVGGPAVTGVRPRCEEGKCGTALRQHYNILRDESMKACSAITALHLF